MSVTHTETLSDASSASQTISGQCVEVGSAETVIDQSYGSGVTDAALAVAFTVAGLQKVFLVSDQPMTIKTNSTGSPDRTITLVAGRPFRWSKSDGYFANPFPTDTTVLYVTTTAAARLRGKVLMG